MLNHPAVKRPVRTRMLGVVGRAGEKPALTRLYARHGHELIGFKSLVSEPLYVKCTAITSERQLQSREALWEGSL